MPTAIGLKSRPALPSTLIAANPDHVAFNLPIRPPPRLAIVVSGRLAPAREIGQPEVCARGSSPATTRLISCILRRGARAPRESQPPIDFARSSRFAGPSPCRRQTPIGRLPESATAVLRRAATFPPPTPRCADCRASDRPADPRRRTSHPNYLRVSTPKPNRHRRKKSRPGRGVKN